MNKRSDTPTTKPKPIDIVQQGLARRYRKERRFRRMGLSAIIVSLVFLSLLFASIISKGYSAVFQTHIQLEVFFDPGRLSQEELARADYPGLVKAALREMFPDVSGRRDKRQLYKLVSSGAGFELRKLVLADGSLIGQRQAIWLPADDDVDMLIKGHVERTNESGELGRLSAKQLAWIDQLTAQGKIRKQFNTTFFTAGDSREPELAGIWGAVCGSFFTLLITEPSNQHLLQLSFI